RHNPNQTRRMRLSGLCKVTIRPRILGDYAHVVSPMKDMDRSALRAPGIAVPFRVCRTAEDHAGAASVGSRLKEGACRTYLRLVGGHLRVVQRRTQTLLPGIN